MAKSPSAAKFWTRIVRIALLVLVVGYAVYTAQQQQQQRPRNGPVVVEPQAESDGDAGERIVVEDVTVRYEDDDQILKWQGDVDLTATVARIRRGERMERWENDGDVFGNFERRLPRQPRGYYREWVHPTPGAPGPGPQRIVSGAEGDLWYTADHYETFIELNELAVPNGS